MLKAKVPVTLTKAYCMENISRHFAEWAENHAIDIHYIQLGKPAQNVLG